MHEDGTLSCNVGLQPSGGKPFKSYILPEHRGSAYKITQSQSTFCHLLVTNGSFAHLLQCFPNEPCKTFKVGGAERHLPVSSSAAPVVHISTEWMASVDTLMKYSVYGHNGNPDLKISEVANWRDKNVLKHVFVDRVGKIWSQEETTMISLVNSFNSSAPGAIVTVGSLMTRPPIRTSVVYVTMSPTNFFAPAYSNGFSYWTVMSQGQGYVASADSHRNHPHPPLRLPLAAGTTLSPSFFIPLPYLAPPPSGIHVPVTREGRGRGIVASGHLASPTGFTLHYIQFHDLNVTLLASVRAEVGILTGLPYLGRPNYEDSTFSTDYQAVARTATGYSALFISTHPERCPNSPILADSKPADTQVANRTFGACQARTTCGLLSIGDCLKSEYSCVINPVEDGVFKCCATI